MLFLYNCQRDGIAVGTGKILRRSACRHIIEICIVKGIGRPQRSAIIDYVMRFRISDNNWVIIYKLLSKVIFNRSKCWVKLIIRFPTLLCLILQRVPVGIVRTLALACLFLPIVIFPIVIAFERCRETMDWICHLLSHTNSDRLRIWAKMGLVIRGWPVSLRYITGTLVSWHEILSQISW